jgi:hypothetical protein
MILIKSPTELTTSATDMLLAIECIILMIYLWRAPAADRWKTYLWCWVFGLLAFSSFIGAVAHGLEMQASMRDALWAPLYLSLGIIVALFVIGALYDLAGRDLAKRLIRPGVAMGTLFFLVVQVLNGAFIIFIIYEAMAMICALVIYSYLSITKRLHGAAIVSSAILLNMVAAGVQASNISIKIIFPFDHNGVFHLIQTIALALLGIGLRTGMKSYSRWI